MGRPMSISVRPDDLERALDAASALAGEPLRLAVRSHTPAQVLARTAVCQHLLRHGYAYTAVARALAITEAAVRQASRRPDARETPRVMHAAHAVCFPRPAADIAGVGLPIPRALPGAGAGGRNMERLYRAVCALVRGRVIAASGSEQCVETWFVLEVGGAGEAGAGAGGVLIGVRHGGVRVEVRASADDDAHEVAVRLLDLIAGHASAARAMRAPLAARRRTA